MNWVLKQGAGIVLPFILKQVEEVIDDPETQEKIKKGLDALIDPIEDWAAKKGGPAGHATQIGCRMCRAVLNVPDYPDNALPAE